MYDGILVIVILTIPQPFWIVIGHRSNFIIYIYIYIYWHPFNVYIKPYLVMNLFNELDFH
jgi:hypothetical protein